MKMEVCFAIWNSRSKYHTIRFTYIGISNTRTLFWNGMSTCENLVQSIFYFRYTFYDTLFRAEQCSFFFIIDHFTHLWILDNMGMVFFTPGYQMFLISNIIDSKIDVVLFPVLIVYSIGCLYSAHPLVHLFTMFFLK